MPRVWVTSPTYDLVVQTVVALREERGLTQRDLAAKLGKPRSFVSKVETKERRLDVLEFVAVARALETPPERLFANMLAKLPESFPI